ncbi:NAD(P)/FAD-dependent oxidoreductase [Nocardioides aequoreus]|uniref:NAD(P)/FAD-dependent oxidoreductase n=1 Tax=Nocardioides aequoreus TaxID=397278 RepID=UPI0004C3C075|nr:FAD-dependent oxidoreductase [Nocardioides aequoreus]
MSQAPPAGAPRRNGEVSHWMAADTTADPTPVEAPEPLPEDADLVVVGGGLTGLWTAYYARQRRPDARIVVLEAARVGYGASGRNGGWMSTLLPGNRAVYARRAGVAPVVAFQRALIETIDECLAVLEREGIEAHQVRGGQLSVARTEAGLARLRAAREGHLRFGYTPEEVELLDGEGFGARVAVDGALGGLYFPATVRVDPARLTRGLARVLRAQGVTVCEGTRVTGVAAGEVTTTRGVVRTRDTAICVEAYSAALLGGRTVIPVNSSVVVTEPLPAATWDRIGWAGQECLNDAAHTFVYCQRTADGRIAIGGRGAPYRYASGLTGDGEVPLATVRALEGRLRSFFPGVELPLAHAWRGSIGVTRDWCAGVHHDPVTRVAVVRGYAGHGVTAANLAARTVLDRLDGVASPLTALPWNEHDSGRWEPEPLRWLGVHGMYRLFGAADRWEERRGSTRTSLLARVGSRLAGLHE